MLAQAVDIIVPTLSLLALIWRPCRLAGSGRLLGYQVGPLASLPNLLPAYYGFYFSTVLIRCAIHAPGLVSGGSAGECTSLAAIVCSIRHQFGSILR